MKSKSQWQEEWANPVGPMVAWTHEEFIAAVQRDALEMAAGICDRIDQRGSCEDESAAEAANDIRKLMPPEPNR